MSAYYHEYNDLITGDKFVTWTVTARSYEAFERMVFRYDPFQFLDDQ